MLAAAVVASLAAVPALQDGGSGLLEPAEIRALVIDLSADDVLGDRALLGATLHRAAEIGFDAVLPVGWKAGKTLAASPALTAAGFGETRAFPGRDVLNEVVFEAHRAGLEVLVALDGALRIDPATPLKLPLAPGAKDRLDPRDPAVRALARAFALELAKAAEIDGFVLSGGLTAFTATEALDPAAKKAVDDAARELAAWREELRAFDPSIVVGWSTADAAFALPATPAGLDFLVIADRKTELPQSLAEWVVAKPGRVAVQRALDAETTAETFAAALASVRERKFAGELLGPWSALAGEENALAAVLTEGIDAPYYARATLPWRDGATWRPAAEMAELVNDSGTFVDVEDAEIPHSTLEAGQRGNASWALKPGEKGLHELWVWLEPGEAELPALSFVIPVDNRRVTRIVLPAGVPRGWTRVGRATFGTMTKQDVLRLEVKEGGAAEIAIGPVVALPRRRGDTR